jgi:ElaB/YqjD/DUF883 family membrane-anchored ribosome-binding protein
MDDQFEPNQGRSGEGTEVSGGTGIGSAAGTATRMKETVAQKASEATDKIADFSRQTVDQIDSQREPVASTLNKTASALHEQGENVASLAHASADKLETTADYLRQHDLKAMMSDVQDLAKRYPGQCLAAAVGVGFLLGRVFRNSD